MEKVYLFHSSMPLPKETFLDALSGIGIAKESIMFDSSTSGHFLAESTLAPSMEALLLVLPDDLGTSVSILACHERGELMEKLSKEALAYFPNQVSFPTDVLMKEISFGDYSSFPFLARLFKGVPHELMLTSGAYLRCGLDASLAAKSIYIHRNTFHYRLNRFIEMTRLDLRDYHNALLLELYFHLSRFPRLS